MASTCEDRPRRPPLVGTFISGGIVLLFVGLGRSQSSITWLGLALIFLGLYLDRRTG
jgi:hypothetical protein